MASEVDVVDIVDLMMISGWCLLQFTMGKLKRSALRNCAQQLSRYGICTDLLYTMSKERVERRGLCSGPYWRHA